MADDWGVSSVLRDARQELEAYGKRVDTLMDATGQKFEKDYSATAAAAGWALCLGSGVLGFLGKSPVVAVSLVVAGVALIILGAVMKRRTADKHLAFTKSLIQLEREKAELATRVAVLQHASLYGLPDSETYSRLRMVLGDESARLHVAAREMETRGVAAPALPSGDDENLTEESA